MQGEIMKITSTVFKNEAMIPAKYTCDGDNVSPPLAFSNVPPQTHSLALIADDPDAPAGTWVHWVIYNMPPSTNALAENVPIKEVLLDGSLQGKNDFQKIGYRGPCPPKGTHRYFFKIYALNTKIDLPPGATKRQLLAKMEGHILAEGSVMGKYTRQ